MFVYNHLHQSQLIETSENWQFQLYRWGLILRSFLMSTQVLQEQIHKHLITLLLISNIASES